MSRFHRQSDKQTVLVYPMKVASLEDALHGKIRAYSDEQQPKSKRQKDLADILRLIEMNSSLTDLIASSIKERIE